jgi:uncharacterized protein YdcH (DUF465 family)
MTREEIVKEMNYRSTQKYLVYLSLQEIMLDYYQDVTMLKAFDLDLKTKHRNMISSLKQKSAEAYRFLENYDDGESTIKQFHEFVTLFERLHNSIDHGGSLFHDCLNSVEDLLDRHEGKESKSI